MLDSIKIQKRQSEIRSKLSELAGNESPTDEQVSAMESMDKEYRANETRYRAALTAEDTERREQGSKLETRSDKEYGDLVANFQMRQVASFLDNGEAFTGQTAEVIAEMRSKGAYRGVPVPLEALEQRANETIASGVPAPTRTASIIDRLFPNSVAASMGARLVNIESGVNEYPVLTSGVSSGWAASETGNVGGPTTVATTNATLSPDQTLGVQAVVTRKALKQAGNGLEDAIRRDMRREIQKALDAAVFQGSGASGQPSGVIAKASGYSITITDNSAASLVYSQIIAGIATLMGVSAANSGKDIALLAHPDVWKYAEGVMFDTGSGITLWDRITAKLGKVILSGNAVKAPATNVSNVLLTTNAGGLNPIFVGVWGGIDLIRDPYSNAHAGELVVTGLMTADVTVSRASQSLVLKTKSA